MDAFVLFGLAESLITKLASRAFEEACQVRDLYVDLQQFTQTISYIKSVLLDADQKQKKQTFYDGFELKNWLWLVGVVLSDAENVLDEVEFQNLRKKVIKDNGGRIITKVDNFFSYSNPLAFRFRMARKIKEINKRLDKIAADRCWVSSHMRNTRFLYFPHMVLKFNNVSGNILNAWQLR
jgi:hypothetical protein